jgi:hypothetical protein
MFSAVWTILKETVLGFINDEVGSAEGKGSHLMTIFAASITIWSWLGAALGQDLSRHSGVISVAPEIRVIERSISAEIQHNTLATQLADPVAPLRLAQALRQAPADLPPCSEQVFDNGPLPRNWPCARVPAEPLAHYNSRHPAVANVEAEMRDIERSIGPVCQSCRD